MTTLTPALDEKARKARKDNVELCGKNRGPHDYIPIEWQTVSDAKNTISTKKVLRMMCRTCFTHVEVGMLVNGYMAAKL